MPDAKPKHLPPQPEPLPPAEHEKALEQEERQQRHRRGEQDASEGELPQTYPGPD